MTLAALYRSAIVAGTQFLVVAASAVSLQVADFHSDDDEFHFDAAAYHYFALYSPPVVQPLDNFASAPARVSRPTASITSTFTGTGDWNTGTNWMHDTGYMGHPNNGLGGNNFNVFIPGNKTASLSEEITVDSLNFSGGPVDPSTLNGGGMTLTVVNTASFVNTGHLRLGTFLLPNTSIPGMLIVGESAVVSASTTTLGAPGDPGTIMLRDGGEFTNSGGLTMVSDGGISAGPGGGGIFRNLSSFAKTGGTGDAFISANFVDNGSGTVRVSSGILNFTGPSSWTGSTLQVSNSALRISGSSTINGMTVALSTDGSVQFTGGTHMLTGTLSGIGDDTTQVIFDSPFAKLSGGTLDLAATAPFAFLLGELGAAGRVTNQGSFTYFGGNIAGEGLRNQATDAGKFVIRGTDTVRLIKSSTLENLGHITFQEGSLTLGMNGVIDNAAAATFLVTGPTVINRETNASGGRIENFGLFHRGPSGSLTVFTGFLNRGTLMVDGGTMSLQGATELYGDGMVNVNGATSRLIIGTGSLSPTSLLSSTKFTFADNGVVEISSGIHTVTGTIALTGIGRVDQTAGTLLVPAGMSATLQGTSTAPFRISGNPARIHTDGTLTNGGVLEWFNGVLAHAGKLVNPSGSTIHIGTNPQISDSTIDGMGRLENAGTMNFGETGKLALGNSGILLNEGANAIIMLGGDTSIRAIGGTIDGEFENRARVVKAFVAGGTQTGSGLIDATYTQTGPSAVLESQTGTIRLAESTALAGGKLVSSNMNGAGSKIEIAGPSTTGTITFEFANGGTIDFTGFTAPVTHRLDGTLTGTGAGMARLVFGTLEPVTGSTATLNFSNGAEFRQIGGTLGGNGTLVNQGTLHKSGGTTVGQVNNASLARWTFAGGSIGATFQNNGGFIWESGNIDGQFTNFSGGTPAMVISGAGLHVVNAGDLLRNVGRIDQGDSSTLTLFGTLRNEGTYLFTGPATIAPGTGTSPPIENTGTGEFIKEGMGTAVISAPFMNDGLGKLTVTGGGLTLTGTLTAPNGGRFRAEANGLLTIQKGTIGGGTHSLVGGAAMILYDSTGSLTLEKELSSFGAGEVRFQGTIGITAPTAFEFSDNAPGRIRSGTMNLSSSLENKRKLLLEGATLNAGASGSFVNTDQLFLVGNPFNTFSGTGAAVQFTNQASGTIFHESLGTLFLSQQTEFLNAGRYELSSNANISRGSPATVFFRNPGTFIKVTNPGTSTVNVPFDNPGSVIVRAGRLDFTGGVSQFTNASMLTAGTWDVGNASTLSLGPGTISENDARIVVRGTGVFTNLPTASFMGTFQNDGRLELGGGASMTLGGKLQNNGYILVESPGKIKANEIKNNGRLEVGTGLEGNVINGGFIAPGQSPGMATIDGTFTQESSGTLEIEIGGTMAGTEFDLVAITGEALLDGTLDVSLIDGAWTAAEGTMFTFLTAESVTGTFSALSLPEDEFGNPLFTVEYLPDSVQLTATQMIPEPSAAILLLFAGAFLLARRGFNAHKS